MGVVLLQATLFLSGIIIPFVLSEICHEEICEYTFVINRERNLVWRHPLTGSVYEVRMVNGTLQSVESPFRPAAANEGFLGEIVDPQDVMTTDGVKRTVLTINRQFPAPNIEVAEGSQVVVNVKNQLFDQAVTIHWHGMELNSNPWMDGVPFVTQCPILPSQSFTYRFVAAPAGTHWYHSHIAAQLSEGLSGLLVVHPRIPETPYFNVLLHDWFHYDAHLYETTIPAPNTRSSGDEVWTMNSHAQVDGTEESAAVWNSALINGRGRYNEDEPWPLTTFMVSQGNTYRFRVVNAGSEFPFALSIDSHVLRVVALDGIDVEPLEVDSVVIGLGERVDFEVITDKADGNYWMRARTLKDLQQSPDIQEVKAIMRYESSLIDSDPKSEYMTCTKDAPCLMLGCRFIAYPEFFNITCLELAHMKHYYTDEDRFKAGLDQSQPDVEYFLNTNISPDHVSFNGYTFMAPSAPVFQTDSYGTPCDTCHPGEPCVCTQTLHVPFNKSVQIVLTNYQLNSNFPVIISHPVHLHGQHFAVVKSGWSDFTYGAPRYSIGRTPNPDITCIDYLCREARWTRGRAPDDLNLYNPPLKDTINVAPSGYVVLRFRSINPGPWLFHCHILHHQNAQGTMIVLLRVGEDHYPPVPPTMPTCQSQFHLSDQQFAAHSQSSLEALNHGGVYQKIQVPSSVACLEDEDNKGKVVLAQGAFIALIISVLVIGGLLPCLAFFIIRACCRPKPRPVKQMVIRSNNIALPVSAHPPFSFYPQPLLNYQ